MHIRRFALMPTIAIAALCGLSPAHAQQAPKPPMVHWVIPALESNMPQTAEQAEAGRKLGRELPQPEVLQPMLDSALPSYEPRRDISITGTFKGASSDVLVVLVQKWFEKFKTYHPGVTLSIAPPYAGILGAAELVKGDLDFVFVSRELRPDDIKFEKLVFPMPKNVAGDRYGVGYSGIAYIDAPVKMIPVVASAGDPPQAPTYENVALATYPLARLTFFNVNKAPGKPLPPALDEFLRFVLSREGQQVVLDHGVYIPLRGNQAQVGRALLGK